MPKLKISLPNGITAAHDLTEDTHTLGRVGDNSIQIDDASVSSHHAEFTRDGDEYILKDLDSTNGTRLNGISHTEGRLKDGDQLTFGNIETIYESENPADAQPVLGNVGRDQPASRAHTHLLRVKSGRGGEEDECREPALDHRGILCGIPSRNPTR